MKPSHAFGHTKLDKTTLTSWETGFNVLDFTYFCCENAKFLSLLETFCCFRRYIAICT